MCDVFLSYDHRDKGFVMLLEDVLRHSGVNIWTSHSSIDPGCAFHEEIGKAITNSDIMIVVVTSHSRKSNWVKREVRMFLSSGVNRRIIPLLLERDNLNDLKDIALELMSLQSVNFSTSYSTGFDTLLGVFGGSFFYKEKRSPRSRGGYDRRDPAAIPRRLRHGFRKEYFGETGDDKFRGLPLLPRNREKVLSLLKPEIVKYRISGVGNLSLQPEVVLREAVDYVWNDLKKNERNGELNPAVNVIETVADYITSQYSAASIDRRSRPN